MLVDDRGGKGGHSVGMLELVGEGEGRGGPGKSTNCFGIRRYLGEFSKALLG